MRAVLAKRPELDVVACRTAEEVLAALEDGHVDLLVLDGRLAGIDGVEVLRRVRQDPRTARLPVVMVSADVQPASATRALAAGADAYIGKPLEFDKVLGAIDRLTTGR